MNVAISRNDPLPQGVSDYPLALPSPATRPGSASPVRTGSGGAGLSSLRAASATSPGRRVGSGNYDHLLRSPSRPEVRGGLNAACCCVELL